MDDERDFGFTKDLSGERGALVSHLQFLEASPRSLCNQNTEMKAATLPPAVA